jgi:formiminotetrahydrofolate cyclodeaminase
MIKLTDRTFNDLLRAFGSSDPTPGGGSASALAGAVGASLLAMVSRLPRPRAADAADVERLEAAGRSCDVMSGRLALLVDRDSDAYDGVVNAYRMAKATEDEKVERSLRIQQALRAAIEAPLDVMRTCAGAIGQAAVIVRFGNRNASSDVQVALELLAAGLRGAKVNVEINLGSITDQQYAGGVRSEAERLIAESTAGVAAAREQLAQV